MMISELEKAKSEVKQTEKDFEAMVEKDGIKAAFVFYSDTNAVLNRNDTLIIGKKAIRELYSKKSTKKVTLKWTPDFVDVSKSLDLAYTYGKYVYSVTDSMGTKDYKGVFHTVWKKQKDGTWKYVWD